MLKPTVFILLSCIFLLPFAGLQAQSTSFGLKGGLNLSRFNTDDGLEAESRKGIHFGAFMMSPMGENEKLFFQPELLFSQQGYAFFKLSYINLPILLKYFPAKHISLHGGLQLGVLVDAEHDAQDFFSTVELGMPLGIEYDLGQNLGLGVRYVLGLTNIDVDEGDNAGVFNRVFQAFVAYRIITH